MELYLSPSGMSMGHSRRHADGRLAVVACRIAGAKGDQEMQWNRLSRAQNVPCAHRRAARSGGWRRAGLLVATVVAGVLFCSAPMRSLADLPTGDQVYLTSGTNVTADVFFVGGQAYLYPNAPEPITINYVVGHVYDQLGNVIGYVTDGS